MKLRDYPGPAAGNRYAYCLREAARVREARLPIVHDLASVRRQQQRKRMVEAAFEHDSAEDRTPPR